MNNKVMTRNKNSLPISFSTAGNFLNIKKMKFIPIDKSLKVTNKNISKKNSNQKLSETMTNNNNKELDKDQIIKQLKERIIYLENKIKILEKERQSNKKARKNSLSKTLILKLNNSNKSLCEKSKVTTIPLDKNLLKFKLSKRKKNIFELLDINKIKKKNRSNSFYATDLNMSKNNKNSFCSTINNSIYNYYTNNSSCGGSALKKKKKAINLLNKSNTTNYIHNLLYTLNAKTAKSKASSSITHHKNKKKNLSHLDKRIGGNQGRKINAIPYNASPKTMMMSSTNCSNNISNSFKEDLNMRKNSPLKNNYIINNSSVSEKNNFNEIKNKLENIQKRTKNLLSFYSSIPFEKNGIHKINNNNINSINKQKIKCANYSHYIKISKLEKLKKE
jgi:hypothetical protein